MTTYGAITSTRSRTIHVSTDGASAAACGASVYVRPYEVGPANEVCKRCRKALGWPVIVTWTDRHGNEFTTDFR